ncbi:tripartite tricarboxylate transporter substrate binding protein [Lysinibacillus capsici]|uniref:tripartite tricarboxylate transporter substrate binding protein n=1 Tax=Lysinibacillus capsici TaxID=2115968 RepID=UPI0032E378DD
MWRNISKIMVAGLLFTSLFGCSASNGEKTEGKNASDYPKSNITIVAPSGAGGGWDLTARAVAKTMSDTGLIDKAIQVENKPGGGGAAFMATFATKEANNDYMLMVKSPPILINYEKAEGNSKFGYKDTTPLAQLTRDYGAIVVKKDSPFQTLADVLNAMKTSPKDVTLAGGSAPGSMDHLVGIIPAYKAGIDLKTIKYVSYDGGGEAVTALLGGNADVIATDASTIATYVKSGDVRVLAVSSSERLEGELAEVPTFKEAGIDEEFTIWRGIFGPKNMSEDAIAYWSEKLQAMSESKEWQAEVTRNGWQAEYRNAQDFTAYLDSQNKIIIELLTALDMQK